MFAADVVTTIINYLPDFEFLDWISNTSEKQNWNSLSFNPNAIDLLKQNQDKINWYNLSQNLNTLDLLEQNQDKIDWNWLSENPNAIDLLEHKIKNKIKKIIIASL